MIRVNYTIQKFRVVFAVIGVLVLFTGCSNPFGNEGSEVDVGHAPGIQDSYHLPNGKGAEPVPASAQNTVSRNRHYLLQGSLATHASGVKSKTTRGYTLYSNVQGQLISGDAGL